MLESFEAWTGFVVFWIFIVSVLPLFAARGQMKELYRLEERLANAFCEIARESGKTTAGWIMSTLVQLKTALLIVFILPSVMLASLIPPFMSMKPIAVLLWITIIALAATVFLKGLNEINRFEKSLTEKIKRIC